MKPLALVGAVLLLVVVLAACGSAQGPGFAVQPPAPGMTATAVPTRTTVPPVTADLTRSDSQGAVEVSVRPLDLGSQGDTVSFEVSLNTHSVDLSMDLTTLASLSTDTARTVQASAWDGPTGGHHVEGTLVFPAIADGTRLLEGARRLTLTIVNVDAPQRTFTWSLAP